MSDQPKFKAFQILEVNQNGKRPFVSVCIRRDALGTLQNILKADTESVWGELATSIQKTGNRLHGQPQVLREIIGVDLEDDDGNPVAGIDEISVADGWLILTVLGQENVKTFGDLIATCNEERKHFKVMQLLSRAMLTCHEYLDGGDVQMLAPIVEEVHHEDGSRTNFNQRRNVRPED
jgi:hypothetical protein